MKTLTEVLESKWCESYEFNTDRSQLTVVSKSYHHSCESFEVTSADVTDEMLDQVNWCCETLEEFEEEVYEHVEEWFENSYGDEDLICFSNCFYEEEFPTLTAETSEDKCEVFRTHPYRAHTELIVTLPANRSRGQTYTAEELEKMVSEENLLSEEPVSGYDHHISLGEEFIANLYKRFRALYEEVA